MNNDVRATLRDIAGRPAASEPAHAYIIENVPASGAGLPSPRIVTPSNNSVVEGHVVTVGGHADPRVTVELFDWLDAAATTQVSDGGTWSMTLDSVDVGEHLYTVRAVNEDGAHSARSSPIVVTVASPAVRQKSLRLRSPWSGIANHLRVLGRTHRREEENVRSDIDEAREQLASPLDAPSQPDPMAIGREDESRVSVPIDHPPQIQLNAALPSDVFEPATEQRTPSIAFRFMGGRSSPFRHGPRWTTEEQAWIDTETFPPVLVRSYSTVKRLKRDARRLKLLGYTLVYHKWDWSGSGQGRATYKQHNGLGDTFPD